jgi:DNA-binding response OmpR family regulator
MRLLIVSDDAPMATTLSASLRHADFSVLRASTGFSAMQMLHHVPDLVILDLDLAGDAGFRVCRQLRTASDIPIIATTARTDSTSRVHCLNLGADDCLVRPYEFLEIVARIHAVSRRHGAARAVPEQAASQSGGVVNAGRVTIYLKQRMVTVEGRRINLTPKEFELLAALARQPGLVLRHEQILTEVWSTDWPETRRTLHVYIAALRQKLGSPSLIESVHGVGYRLAVAAR